MSEQRFPLYQHAIHKKELNTEGNQGLRFERFFEYDVTDNKWTVEGENDGENKRQFIDKFQHAGETSALEEHSKKQIQLLKALTGEVKVFATDGHLVTGMGNAHPIENGMLWHHTLGVPYLTGSQVKGLVRAAIEQYYADEDNKAALLQRWFGSDDKNTKNQQLATQAGSIIFFDALPVKTVSLTTDIMTPHMEDWYAKGAEISSISQDADKIPADWHEPKPIPFLAIKQAKLLFAIAARTAQAQAELPAVWEVLEYALTSMGAGSKTQTGYGYFVEDKRSLDELLKMILDQAKEKEDADKKAASNVGKSLLFVELNENDWLDAEKKNEFNLHVDSWLEKLTANPDADAINLFKQLVELHYGKELLLNPNKTQGKKNKPVYKDRQRKLAEDLNALLAQLT